MKFTCTLLTAFSLLSPLLSPGAPATEAPRAEKPAMKGVELYSWKDGKGKEWRFSLLPGTNRAKTPAEIMDAKTMIKTLDELKTRLSALAVGEQVFWNSHVDAKAFPLPGEETVREIKGLTETNKLKLSLPEKKKEAAPRKTEAPTEAGSLEILQRSTIFLTGNTGEGAEVSTTGLAFRVLLNSKTAGEQFLTLFNTALSPAGKVYALTGLHKVDEGQYRKLRDTLADDQDIPCQFYCIEGKQTGRELKTKIESGALLKAALPLR